MKMQGVIAGSSVEKISGDLGYTGGGTGGGRAPMMPDFEEFEDQFDFTNIKLWQNKGYGLKVKRIGYRLTVIGYRRKGACS